MSADLQMAFELASLREMVADLGRLPDRQAGELWRGVREMMDGIEAEREEENELHRRNYDARVEAQKAAVRDDDKAPRRDFEPDGYGGAKFDERMVERVARSRVDHGHKLRLMELDRKEWKALRAIQGEATSLLCIWGRAERDFNGVSRNRSRRRRGQRRERSERSDDD